MKEIYLAPNASNIDKLNYMSQGYTIKYKSIEGSASTSSTSSTSSIPSTNEPIIDNLEVICAIDEFKVKKKRKEEFVVPSEEPKGKEKEEEAFVVSPIGEEKEDEESLVSPIDEEFVVSNVSDGPYEVQLSREASEIKAIAQMALDTGDSLGASSSQVSTLVSSIRDNLSDQEEIMQVGIRENSDSIRGCLESHTLAIWTPPLNTPFRVSMGLCSAGLLGFLGFKFLKDSNFSFLSAAGPKSIKYVTTVTYFGWTVSTKTFEKIIE